MAVTVTRTFFGEMVGPDHVERRYNVGFYAGETLLVDKDYDYGDGCEWMKTRDGWLVGIPEGNWEQSN